MMKMSYERMVRVIQAKIDGEVIEYRNHMFISDKSWKPTAHPLFDFYESEYRVKRVPREFFVELDRYGDSVNSGVIYNNLFQKNGHTIIRVREVFDDS